MTGQVVRVVLADDEAMVRAGLRLLLDGGKRFSRGGQRAGIFFDLLPL